MAAPQKVVIPKGACNPLQTTIVEIPNNLKHAPTVVARARPRPFQQYESWEEPSYYHKKVPKIVRKKLYRRKSFPKVKQPGYGALHDQGLTFGGMPAEYSEDPTSIEFQYPMTPPPSYRDLSGGPIPVYGFGIADHIFNPLGPESTPQDLSYKEGSLYRDFRPKRGMSSKIQRSPGYSPASMKKYHSGPSYSTSASAEESCEPSCPGASDSYEQYSGMDEYTGEESREGLESYREPPSASSPMKKEDMVNSLGELETSELSQIMGDLNSFQSARRKLLLDASSLASAADFSEKWLAASAHF